MTTTEEQGILKRIEKLLRLADTSRGATEAEAQAALAKAEALMMQHKIDRARLKVNEEQADESEEINEHKISCGRKDSATRLICSILQRFFHVRVIFSRFTIYFVGEQDDIQFALYAFEYLQNSFRRLWLSYKRTNPTAHKPSYHLGLFKGFSRAMETEKAKQEQAQSAEDKNRWAIIIRDNEKALDKFVMENHGRLRNSTFRGNFRAGDSLSAGIAHGQNIRISRPLGGGATRTATLALQ